jgi:hypothetical protein
MFQNILAGSRQRALLPDNATLCKPAAIWRDYVSVEQPIGTFTSMGNMETMRVMGFQIAGKGRSGIEVTDC